MAKERGKSKEAHPIDVYKAASTKNEARNERLPWQEKIVSTDLDVSCWPHDSISSSSSFRSRFITAAASSPSL